MLQALLAISLSLLSNSIRHMFEAQEAMTLVVEAVVASH